MRLCNAPACSTPSETITFHGRERHFFVHHACQTPIIIEKTLCIGLVSMTVHLIALMCVYTVCWISLYGSVQGVCMYALMANTTRKGGRRVSMFFLWLTCSFGYMWLASESSWLPVMLSSTCWPKVWPSQWTNHSQLARMDLQPHNKGFSCIKSTNRLAACETIPSAVWPTCYWEMTCFPKLHHEAEMINGLKSDKRIWSGLLFPAYFNHVVMKWIQC